jgi:hypothetical protein
VTEVVLAALVVAAAVAAVVVCSGEQMSQIHQRIRTVEAAVVVPVVPPEANAVLVT